MDGALSFLREELLKSPVDKDAATLLLKIGQLSAVDNDVFSSAIPRELAVQRNPGLHSDIFDLAYAYADIRRYRSRAYWLYQRIYWDEERKPNIRNNVGIIWAM